MTIHTDKWVDLVGRKLFGIESVTTEEQSRMVQRCAKAVSQAMNAELRKCRAETLWEAVETLQRDYQAYENANGAPMTAGDLWRRLRHIAQEVEDE